MSPIRRAVAGVLACVALGCGKERVDPIAAPIAEFSRRVDEYVALHNKLAEQVGPLDMTKSQTEIAARATALANSISSARSDAKPGDIFYPDVATVFATLIKEEYSRRTDSVRNSRQDAQRELTGEEVIDFEPKVNMVYPTQYPLPTFPATLLPLLPQLPEQVEYRIVKNHILLRDVEANLIVDFMRLSPQAP